MDKYLSPLVSCIECRAEKSAKGIFSHFITKHTEDGKQRWEETRKKGTENSFSNKEWQDTKNKSRFRVKQENSVKTKTCPKCSSDHTKSGIFCSRTCSNSRIHTEESNNKRRKTLLEKPKIEKYFSLICVNCSKNFTSSSQRKCCSDACVKERRLCGSKNGARKAASKRCLRSKDEIKLYELCKNYFQNVTHNDTSIANGWDADILIHDTKTAILWNGPWHYKEMGFSNHSLSQVQNRDRIKMKKFESVGWKIVIFEDRYFTPETAFLELVAGGGNAPPSEQTYETCLLYY